jgi:hypothetical protein
MTFTTQPDNLQLLASTSGDEQLAGLHDLTADVLPEVFSPVLAAATFTSVSCFGSFSCPVSTASTGATVSSRS